mgnify:CR=1 FL=1
MSIDVQSISVNGQQTYSDGPFPLVLACQSENATLEEAAEWARQNLAYLQEQLTQAGTILFRDFPLSADQDFDAFIKAFDFENFRYEDSLSNAVRVNRTERVFTANEAPPEVTIYLHHEMAQTPNYPSKLFFFCELAAETG